MHTLPFEPSSFLSSSPSLFPWCRLTLPALRRCSASISSTFPIFSSALPCLALQWSLHQGLFYSAAALPSEAQGCKYLDRLAIGPRSLGSSLFILCAPCSSDLRRRCWCASYLSPVLSALLPCHSCQFGTSGSASLWWPFLIVL